MCSRATIYSHIREHKFGTIDNLYKLIPRLICDLILLLREQIFCVNFLNSPLKLCFVHLDFSWTPPPSHCVDIHMRLSKIMKAC